VAGRLGGSGYRAEEFDLELDAEAGVGFSSLHALRRDALEALDAERLAPWSKRRVPRLRPASPRGVPPAEVPRLVAIADRAGDARALREAGAAAVFAEVRDGGSPPSADVGVAMRRIVTDEDLAGALASAMHAPGGCLTGNVGLLSLLAGGPGVVMADAGVNAANPWTLAVLAGLGAGSAVLSQELSGAQIVAVTREAPLPVGVVVFGRTELMIAENCVLAALGPCGRRCSSCARRGKAWELVDRKGYRFPVSTDAEGRTHLYNSVTLDLSGALPELVSAGVHELVMDVRGLAAHEATRIVAAFRSRLADAVARRGGRPERLVTPATTGHFYRGVS
jgi:putative protease